MVIKIVGSISRLELTLSKRIYPDGDGWSRDYVATRFYTELPSFRADFDGEVRLDDLERFYKQVQSGYLKVAGVMELHSGEGELRLSGEFDELGRIPWSVNLSYPVGAGRENTMHFVIESDQSYLPMLLHQIRETLELFSRAA